MTFHDFLENKRKELQRGQQRVLLALDSSTQLASVALVIQDQIVFSEECFRQKSHSEWINGALERAKFHLPGGWEQIDVVAVTHGPGSFTGVRVATNLAKSMGYALNKPLVSLSSLEVLAYQSVVVAETPLVLPVINAFKNMVFLALFERQSDLSLKTIVEPRVVEVNQLEDFIRHQCSSLACQTKVQILGDGVFAYKDFFNTPRESLWFRSENPQDNPTATMLAQLISSRWSNLHLLHWRELIPTYLRASAAEENKTHPSSALDKPSLIFP